MNPSVRRGDVVWVNFDVGVGCEIHKVRPAIVISSDGGNLNLRNQMLTVLPLTRVRRDRGPRTDEIVLGPGEGGLKRDSVTVSNQVRSVDRRRIVRRLGRVSVATLQAIGQRLQQVLSLA